MLKIYNKTKTILGLGLVLAGFNFKLKTENSYLGTLWYLFDPLFTFLLLFLIFSNRLGNNIDSYPLYLFLGIIVFSFFSKTTTELIKLVVENRWLIRSIKFPYESLVLAGIFKNLFSHFFEVVLLMALTLFFGQSIIGFIFYPIILFVFCFFIYGVCLLLSSLYVYFCDLENVWDYFSRLLWFATPVFYSFGNQNELLFFNLFNPLYLFIEIFRESIIYLRSPKPVLILVAIFFSFLFFASGTIVFNKLKHSFPEKI
jgi:lipopolysaccharide transport system permease protein